MASSATKAVSFRVPVDSYVELLQEAKESGLNITDLLYTKIFPLKVSSAKDDIQALTDRIENLEKELSLSSQSLKFLETEKKELTNNLDRLCYNFRNDIENIVLENEQLKQENHFLSSESEDFKAQINRLEEENEDLDLAIKQLRNGEERLYDTVNSLERVANSVDKYKQDIQSLKASLKEADKTALQLQKDKVELQKQIEKNAISEENSKAKMKTQLTQSKEQVLDFSDTIDILKKKNISISNSLQAEQRLNHNLKIEVTEHKNKLIELRDTHNDQVIELHKQISKWVSYTEADINLFNRIMW